MKRLHVHVSVGDIAESIRFYSTLFATSESRLRTRLNSTKFMRA